MGRRVEAVRVVVREGVVRAAVKVVGMVWCTGLVCPKLSIQKTPSKGPNTP